MKLLLSSMIKSFMILGLLSCTEKNPIQSFDPPTPEVKPEVPEEKPEVPDQPETNAAPFINCSYIRGDFYELGNVSAESMNACTDLIYLEARPYDNGDLTFDLPDNAADFGKAATYKAEYKGRQGVAYLNGTGKIACGEGLLDSPRYEVTKGYNQFSIGTYIYLDEWTHGATLFEKNNAGALLNLQLDSSEGNLKLSLNRGASEAVFKNTSLKAGTWHHVTFTFNTVNGTVCKLYVDNQSYTAVFSKTFNDKFFMNQRGVFYIGGAAQNGKSIKGYLDETYVCGVDTKGNMGKTPIQFSNWNESKVLAYWKYDDASAPGKDSHSWLTRLADIRQDIAANQNVKLRLGVIGGKSEFWKKMAAQPAARANFANQVKALLNQHHFAGVDLDLEWSYTTQEFANYSATILKLRETLGKEFILSASLHPVSYTISKEAINALDFISLQCYGPKPTWLPYEKFVKCGEDVVAYGIPKEKLVMGVPFYGTTGQQIEAYRSFFANVTSTADNSVSYKGNTFQFDNIDRMRQKTEHICTAGYRGVMSWDLANDLPFTHERSLLKCVDKVIKTHFAESKQ